ncbi:hypothetical protein PIROE2DRAFT_58097 [Piromyces sp. E2]|nr:hypothetical protein PIROE2DRAFT_58097 [Piromyces sp. E2]|eukprot:OUM68445.1 hypothetical protein PIROE2DRAFT_58097 [Piromyces sp. E2]
MNYNVHNIISRARMLTSSMALGQLNILQMNLPQIENYISIIEEEYIPILKKYIFYPPSEHPIVIYEPNSEESTKSEYVNLNGYELIKNIIVWTKGLFKISPEEWIGRYYYFDVIEESMKILYNDEIASQNNKILILYIFTGVLIALSLLINFLGLTPLYNNTRRLYDKTMGMFKHLLKGSINDMVSKFEICIESITETYDISIDARKNKYKIDSQTYLSRNIKKMKGYVINFLLIATILCVTIPIIIKNNSIVKNVNYNMNAKVQKQLYSGTIGLPSTKDMRYLDSLIIEQKCKMDEESCANIEEDMTCEYTESIVKLGLNELIDEFLDKMKVILMKSKIKNIKNTQYIYYNDHNFIIKAISAYTTPEFLFELNIMQHILAGLEKFDSILYNNIYESIRTSVITLLIITIVGVVLIISAALMTYRTVVETNESLNELVDIIFIIPQSTINMIPQFKRFIETSSFEEE